MADQKPKGRPAGSPNIEYAEVEFVPAVCPKCKGSELKKVQGSKVIKRAIAGKLRSGFIYSRMTWTRKRCKCGQMVMVRAFFP